MSSALYLISPPRVSLDAFLPMLRQAFEGGKVAALQLRLKDVDDDDIIRIGEAVRPICAEHDTAFILNDRADLAHRLLADGVHLGQGDGSVTDARALLGPHAQIGVTCHNSRHLAMEAGEAGADYVAFGAFYPTITKTVSHSATPDILEWWSKIMEIPCVAIGGITAQNAPILIEAGADFLAVSSAVWDYPGGPAAGVRILSEQLSRGG